MSHSKRKPAKRHPKSKVSDNASPEVVERERKFLEKEDKNPRETDIGKAIRTREEEEEAKFQAMYEKMKKLADDLALEYGEDSDKIST